MNIDYGIIVTIIVGMVGIIFGIVFTNRSIKKIPKEDAFIKAASEFYNVFIDFIQDLESKITVKEITDLSWTQRTVDRIEPIQKKAMIKFRKTLPKDKRNAFKLACEYYLYPNKHEKPDLPRMDYFSGGSDIRSQDEEERRIRKEIYKRLKDVLRFTEIK